MGTYLLASEYARSFDLKPAADSTVIIYCPDGKLSAPKAEQMCGRSCRGQGKGRTVLFLKGNTALRKDAWDRLSPLEHLTVFDCGKNLRRFFEHCLDRTPNEVSALKTGMEHKKWMCSVNDFQFNCVLAWSLFNKLDK